MQLLRYPPAGLFTSLYSSCFCLNKRNPTTRRSCACSGVPVRRPRAAPAVKVSVAPAGTAGSLPAAQLQTGAGWARGTCGSTQLAFHLPAPRLKQRQAPVGEEQGVEAAPASWGPSRPRLTRSPRLIS